MHRSAIAAKDEQINELLNLVAAGKMAARATAKKAVERAAEVRQRKAADNIAENAAKDAAENTPSPSPPRYVPEFPLYPYERLIPVFGIKRHQY